MLAMNVYPLLSSVSPGTLGLRISPASLFRFALPVKGDWIGALYTFIDPTVSSSV